MNLINRFSRAYASCFEKKRVIRELTEAKSRLELILDSLNEGVVVIDKSFKILLANQSARDLLGASSVKLGKPIWEISTHLGLVELYGDMLHEDEFITKELELVYSNSCKILRFDVLAVSKDNVEDNMGWVMLIADITKEKEIDRMKSEFVSTTSHELRTPLAAIKESVMLILDETAGSTSDAQKRFLTIARRNIDRLTQLINDVLDISRLETGELKLKKTYCNVEELVKSISDSLALLVKENKLNLRYKVAKDVSVVACDEDRVAQVLANLLGNAIKFTPAGGDISIEVEICNLKEYGLSDENRGLLFSVVDSGVGIEEADMERLFERFGQIGDTLTKKPDGAGLGLAICKELVEMHGGKIFVKSEAGRGSTFQFILPI